MTFVSAEDKPDFISALSAHAVTKRSLSSTRSAESAASSINTGSARTCAVPRMTCRMLLIVAGHPPPYVRDGTSSPMALEFDDLPLSLRQRNARHARSLALPPGTVLLF